MTESCKLLLSLSLSLPLSIAVVGVACSQISQSAVVLAAVWFLFSTLSEGCTSRGPGFYLALHMPVNIRQYLETQACSSSFGIALMVSLEARIND